MTGRKGILFVLGWLIVADQATAFMSRCFGGFCFISSPPATNTLSWDSAQQWCRENGTRLIEITNKDIQSAMSDFLNSINSTYYYNDRLFTNGKRNEGSWTWVTRKNASSLSIGRVSDASYAYGYLQLTTSGFTITASRPTNTEQGYICENESQCTSATGVLRNSRCYRSYSNESLSWYDARSRCLTNGGDLASFDFIYNNQDRRLSNGSWLASSTNYWIGLRQEWWTWEESQADIKYSNWSSDNPFTYPNDPNDCLCLQSSTWTWTICRCNESNPFICLSEIRSSATTTDTTSSTTTSTTTPSTTLTSHSPTTSTTTTKSTTLTSSAIKTSYTAMASESNGVPTPTIPTMVTSRSNLSASDAQSVHKPIGFAEFGLTVGLAIGIPLVIVIAVLAVFNARLRKQLRQALLSLETNQTTSSKNRIQQPAGGDMHELSGMTGDPYETLQPRTERTATYDGLYQSLDPSTKMDSSVLSSNRPT